MKTRFFLLLMLVASFTLTSCNRFYKTPDFHRKTREHTVIAVLPYEIRITGRLPKNLTPEAKQALEEAESVAFQRNFYNKVHLVGNRGRRDLTVRIQPVDQTNQKLEEHGISIRDSWTEDPQKLAQLLGVDAVVRGRAEKERFMSEWASLGVATAAQVAGLLLGVTCLPFIGPNSNEVEVAADIIDGKTGEVLFVGRDEVAVDFTMSANQAVEVINRRICRRFPYTD